MSAAVTPTVPPLPAQVTAAAVPAQVEAVGDVAKGKISLQARAKKLSLSITIDTFAMLFMCLCQAGPTNLSLSWGVYTDATYPRVPSTRFDIYTGIFGTCRIPQTLSSGALPVCLSWWNDPYYTLIYSRFFLTSMAGLANFCIFVLFFGALYACFRPGLDGFVCMVTTGALACMAWIPTFIMMTWLHSDLGNFVFPYRSSYLSAGFWNALVALMLCFASLGVKMRAYKAPMTADEKAAKNAIDAEMKRRQELQAQGIVVVPMQPMQPQPMYYQPVQAVSQAPAGYYASPVQTYAAAPPQAYAAPPAQSYAAPVQSNMQYSAPPTATYEVPAITAPATGDSSLSVSVPGTDAKMDVKV